MRENLTKRALLNSFFACDPSAATLLLLNCYWAASALVILVTRFGPGMQAWSGYYFEWA